MKVACPSCNKPLNVPDEWAGRTARCPFCKAAFTVPLAGSVGPKPTPPQPDAPGADAEAAGEDGINLEALADLEPPAAPARPVDLPPPKPTRKRGPSKAQPPSQKKTPPVIQTPDGKIYRVCPYCGHRIKTDDPNTEVLCSNCWQTVPALTPSEEEVVPEGQILIGGKGIYRDRTVGFYDGLVLALAYPLGAIDSIAFGAAIAAGIILIPAAALMGLVYILQQEPIYGHLVKVPEWVRPAIVGTLLVELVYFAGVGYYALLDSIKSTLTGREKAPSLVWNLTTVTNSLISYICLVVFYAATAALALRLSGADPFRIPANSQEFQKLFTPTSLILLASLTFFVPMSIIGMATARGFQGLNPFRVVRSIINTLGHYIFLYCIVLVYAGLYGVAVAAMLDYSGQTVVELIQSGLDQGLPKVALGVAVWALLIGAGFYGQYVLGRLLGLFARTFGHRLAFES